MLRKVGPYDSFKAIVFSCVHSGSLISQIFAPAMYFGLQNPLLELKQYIVIAFRKIYVERHNFDCAVTALYVRHFPNYIRSDCCIQGTHSKLIRPL